MSGRRDRLSINKALCFVAESWSLVDLPGCVANPLTNITDTVHVLYGAWRFLCCPFGAVNAVRPQSALKTAAMISGFNFFSFSQATRSSRLLLGFLHGV